MTPGNLVSFFGFLSGKQIMPLILTCKTLNYYLYVLSFTVTLTWATFYPDTMVTKNTIEQILFYLKRKLVVPCFLLTQNIIKKSYFTLA